MAKSNEQYWQERGVQFVKAMEDNGEEYLQHREKTVRAAVKELETEINAWYQKYADNGISLTQAKQFLTKAQLENLKMSVDEYIKLGPSLDPDVQAQMNQASIAAHVSRLQSMKISMMGQVEKIYDEAPSQIEKTIRKVYKDSYYINAFNVQQHIGVGFDIAKVDEKKLDKLVHRPWTPDGRDFSDRVWTNKKKLMNELNTTFTQGVIRGQNPDKIIENITQKINADQNSTRRLVMTEDAHFAAQATKDSYNELDIEQYQVLATLDSHTSETCQALDGKIFKQSEYESGVTAPPFHVYCRSTTVPYYGNEYANGKRAARENDNDEGYELIDENLTYNDWHDHYVDGKPLKKKGKSSLNTKKKQIINKALENNQKQIDAFQLPENKEYSDIWKDNVALSEWPTKKDSVQAKFDYFQGQIGNGKDVAKFTALSDKLTQYNADGEAYAAKVAELKLLKDKNAALKAELAKLEKPAKATATNTAEDLYDQAHKDAAYWFKSNQLAEADALFREDVGEIWRNASKAEKFAIYEYTVGSGRFNRPLAGYRKPYYEHGHGWEWKYYVGANKVWIDYEGAAKEIRNMTNIISRSKTKVDMWVNRGCDTHAIDSFLGLKHGEVLKMTPEQLQKLVGGMGTINNFVSTGTAKSTGFNDKDTTLNIYIPRGTEAMYAEPFSEFGKTGLNWDGKEKVKVFGEEFETIIQRGAKYIITKVEKQGSHYYIDMEVHPELGYNKFQQDEHEWQGPTDNFKDEN